MSLSSNQLKHRHRLGQFVSTQGVQMMAIDLTGPMTKLALRLTYTHTSGAAAAVGVLFQQNARFLQNVQMIIQGRDTVWNITPSLYTARRTYEAQGVPPRGMEMAINAAANQVTNVDLTIPLHFDLVRGRKREDAALDLRGLTMAQLKVQFGNLNASDLWTTPNGAAITNVVCTAEGEYILNAKPATGNANSPGDTYITRSLDELEYPITGTSTNFAFDIDARTGLAIRTLFYCFQTNSIGDDTLLPVTGGVLKLFSGAATFEESEAGFLKADVRDEFMIPVAAELAGVDFLDVLLFGKLSTSIPTGNLDANLKTQLNVTYAAGNSQVWVQREATRPLKI